jgi:hypothetical protein
MTQDEEIRRGQEAGRLLNDPMLKGAFDSVEKGLVDAMRRVAMGDKDTQHELVLSLQLLARVKGHMLEAMETGKLAVIQKETMAQKARRFMRAA